MKSKIGRAFVFSYFEFAAKNIGGLVDRNSKQKQIKYFSQQNFQEFYLKMELEASDSEKKQLSYSTQYFGHTPDAFVDSITAPSIDIINDNLQVSKRLEKLREIRLKMSKFPRNQAENVKVYSLKVSEGQKLPF